ncbi:CAMK/RAD53 protein kinase [Thecamonas trahens ATCC 50062]|uniref:CAMK/RAD53 protein kinase n=1 Tax=Thecamonas trahens ATCC 50062 TaxID=461836 RepID=A0A0L0DN35_THETB|nr:CAMK/RAD53 protein kinase [Thecamonas trahens ATCC 50062]KNC53436.1 CAMK/RAD53 protein kinase [Thecamonas trahens ATCC 50062]|eukprot:XP_013754471.1 CAMK/RAD53 protein kinase [Thecamonas trahens ATCC 50062]
MADAAATLEYDEADVAMDVEGGSGGATGAWGQLHSLNHAYPSIDLTDGEVTFGRASICTHQFDVNLISGTHCKLHKDPTGAVIVEDKSSNGTFINGKKIGRNKTALIKQGDRLQFLLKQKNMEPIEYVFKLVAGSVDAGTHSFVEERYDLERVLGKGNFAEVRLGLSRRSGEKYAVKIVDKTKFLSLQQRAGALLDEVNILKFLSHPNIVSLEETFETEKHLYLVLELVSGGELFDVIVNAERLSEALSRKLFVQMLDAVAYLHEQGIAHRDLKPENILIGEGDVVKISDFGLSRITSKSSVMGTVCGTPQYLAPEILKSKEHNDGYNVAVDMWSLGVILYVMLSGMLPFDDNLPMSVFEQIQRGLYSFPDTFWSSVSESAKDLCRRLMQVEPSARWTAKQARAHPWCVDKSLTATPIPIADTFASVRTEPVPRYRGHATLRVMIKAAIMELAEPRGSAPDDIAAFVSANYADAETTGDALKPKLDGLVADGVLAAAAGGKYKLKMGKRSRGRRR